MTDLRKLARGRACTIRVPSHCTNDPEQVVLCHYRRTFFPPSAGFRDPSNGWKSPDWLAAYGCFACHQIVDGQRDVGLSTDSRRLLLAEGIFRTWRILIDEGVIHV